MRIPAALLSSMAVLLTCSAAPAAQSMKSGPVVTVASQAPSTRAPVQPDCAFDGDKTFLIVWQQGEKFYEREDPGVFVVRLSAEGKVLDPKPIVLSSGEGSRERPRVRFAGGVFLVVWQDLRNGKDWDVYAARVTPEGRILDKDGIRVSGEAHSQAMPDVAAGPNGFLVVWQDFRNGRFYRPYAAHVSATGKVREPRGVELKHKGKALAGGTVSVVRAGTVWFLSWSDERAWAPGARGMNTLRMGRLDDVLNVLDLLRSPCGLLARSRGRFFGDGRKALFAATFTAGHGGGHSPAVAVLYDSASAKALKNPNTEKRVKGLSGFTNERMIILRETRLGAQGPVGVGCDGRKYLATFRGLRKGLNKDTAAGNKILAMRLGLDGKRTDPADKPFIIHQGKVPGMNPAVAGGKEGTFLVCYETEGVAGKHLVVARLVREQ